jgi:phage baseplate assembly protein W
MATLPTTGENLDLIGFALDEQPGYTHKLDIDRNKVTGMTDKRDALIQAVYLSLNVERYAYPIYSRNYGSELTDLIGKPKHYAMSEIKRRITEALEQDDRITSVDTWTFETGRRSVLASFVVHSIYGDMDITKEVEI